MKRILSYLWPFTKVVRSNINGILEITWINGKKVLDSQNANYSYGTLQRLLNYGLSKIDLQKQDNILLLGLGAGSVIKSLRNTYNHTGKITAIEIDKVVIDIAIQEFDIGSTQNLEIVQTDAFSYVHNCKSLFDLIIVDIFIDNKVPVLFYTLEFWNKISSLTNSDGHIIFNAGIHLESNRNIDQIITAITDIQFVQYDKVEGANTVLIGKKRL